MHKKYGWFLIVRMLILKYDNHNWEIKNGRDKKKCKKCGQFLYETSKDGWIHFAPKTSIVSNGSEFHVRCSHCKEEAIIKIK